MTIRTVRAQNALNDEKKAQKILKDESYDRFDSVCTLDFWCKLARILANELEKATVKEE